MSATGLEPATYGLKARYSTIKLRTHILTGIIGIEPISLVSRTNALTVTLYPYFLVQGERLELSTACLSDRNSDQLNYPCIKWTEQDLNLQRLELHPNALPIELSVQKEKPQT